MVPIVVALVLGLLVAQARRPLGVHSARPALRHIEFLIVGVGLHLVALTTGWGDLAPLVTAAAIVALLVMVAGNLHLTGMLVIGVGLLANLAGVALNGGMPVRPDALVRAGVVQATELDTVELRGGRHLESSADVAPVLGDVLAVPTLGVVLSFGDLIVLAGLADTVADLGRRRRRRWSPAERAGYAAARSAPGAVAAHLHPTLSPAPGPTDPPLLSALDLTPDTPPLSADLDLRHGPPPPIGDRVAVGPTR